MGNFAFDFSTLFNAFKRDFLEKIPLQNLNGEIHFNPVNLKIYRSLIQGPKKFKER